MKLHLDTDLGGDIDDLQALAFLLGSPEVELTGITTVAEDPGRRAGYVRRALELADRVDIPVAADIDADGHQCLATRRGPAAVGPEMDYNVQLDVAAAATVLSCSWPLLVPLGISMRATIRRSHLARLRGGGRLATLIVRQAEAFDTKWHNAARYGPVSGVPEDMMNFLYDPVACAIASGWREGVHIDTLPIVWESCEGDLVQWPGKGGKRLRVVVGLDGTGLEEEWLRRVSGTALETHSP